jgi:minor curlin subunit
MRYGKQLLAASALLAAVSVASEASAGSRPPTGLLGGGFANANVSFQTIVEFGNYAPPVTIVENSSINFARVIQFGGTGTVDATIVQNGTRNYVNVVQLGGTTNAAIGQFGVSNMANITQVGDSTNSLLLQVGDMNTGTIRQSGWFGWLPMLLFGR